MIAGAVAICNSPFLNYIIICRIVLIDVIGLSQTTCDCFPALPTDKVLSGQYMDNLEHGISLKSLNLNSDCSEGSIWDLMNKARTEAIDDFETQLLLEISNEKIPLFDNYRSFIGEKDNNGNGNIVTHLKNYAGLTVKPMRLFRGLQMLISSISLDLNAAGTFDLLIINLTTRETIKTLEITTDANGLGNATIATPFLLPYSDEYGNPISYAFAYERGAFLPKDYKYHCGCSSVPQPKWMKSAQLTVGGFNEDTLEIISTDRPKTSYSSGLLIDFSIVCPALDWTCNVTDSYWKNTALGKILAKTLVLMTNVKLIQYLLNTNNVSAYTLLSREAMYGKRTQYRNLSSQLIKVIANDYFPTEIEHCFACNPKRNNGFGKSEIIV